MPDMKPESTFEHSTLRFSVSFLPGYERTACEGPSHRVFRFLSPFLGLCHVTDEPRRMSPSASSMQPRQFILLRHESSIKTTSIPFFTLFPS